MHVGSMIRSGITEKTAGYGNTRTGVVLTSDYIRDNELCEGDFVVSITAILQLQPAERVARLDELRQWWLNWHADGSKNHYAAKGRFDSMLTTAMLGKRGIRLIKRGNKAGDLLRKAA